MSDLPVRREPWSWLPVWSDLWSDLFTGFPSLGSPRLSTVMRL
jgi:hypothetical protein